MRSYTVKPILAAVALVSAMSGAQAAPTVDEYKAQFAAALKNHDPTQTAEGVFQPFIDNSDKTDYQTQLNLGLAVLSHKHVIGALEVLGPAAKLNPTDPVVHGALGLAYRGVGDHDRAIAEYRLALEHGKGVHPETLNWATHLGWLLVSKHQFDEAAQVCSVKAQPTGWTIAPAMRLGCLVFAHAGAGRPGPAIQAIEELKALPNGWSITSFGDALKDAGVPGFKLLAEHFPGHRSPPPLTIRGSWPTRAQPTPTK